VRTELYVSTRFGELTTNPIGAWTHPHFLPAAIPRELTLDPETLASVSRADLALGRLARLAFQPAPELSGDSIDPLAVYCADADFGGRRR
jgi:hypothetical protein